MKNYLASTLAFNSKKALKIKAFFLSSYIFNSCRPHQNRVIMQNKRINARFFCIFDGFMRSKTRFFDKNPCFWRPFWRPHFNIVSFMTKALRVHFSKSFFLYEIKIQTAPNPFDSS